MTRILTALAIVTTTTGCSAAPEQSGDSEQYEPLPTVGDPGSLYVAEPPSPATTLADPGCTPGCDLEHPDAPDPRVVPTCGKHGICGGYADQASCESAPAQWAGGYSEFWKTDACDENEANWKGRPPECGESGWWVERCVWRGTYCDWPEFTVKTQSCVP